MGDRVAFIGGKTVGRDHFPFPVPTFGSDAAGIYPLLISFEQAMHLVWRVRKWRVHGSLSNTRGSTSTSFDWIATIGDDTEQSVGSQASTITREAQLVLGPKLQSSDVLDDEEAGAYGLELLAAFPVPLKFADPNFRAGFRFISAANNGIDAFLISQSGFGGVTATSVTAAMIIAGSSVGFTVYKETSETGTITGSVTIEPSEYWPYAARDNSPVYNTATGAQLQSPFN